MGLLDEIHGEIQRYRNRTFLKAAMAACALSAYADGSVTLSERYSIDDILTRFGRLRIYDPHKAIAILDEFLEELRSNTEEAHSVLVGKLRRMADDPVGAELVAKIALIVSHADGEPSAAEKAQFDEICRVLRVEGEELALADPGPLGAVLSS